MLGVHVPTKEASLSSADTQGLLLWALLINEPFMGLMAFGHVPTSWGTSRGQGASMTYKHFQSSHAEAALARGGHAEPMG